MQISLFFANKLKLNALLIENNGTIKGRGQFICKFNFAYKSTSYQYVNGACKYEVLEMTNKFKGV